MKAERLFGLILALAIIATLGVMAIIVINFGNPCP